MSPCTNLWVFYLPRSAQSNECNTPAGVASFAIERLLRCLPSNLARPDFKPWTINQWYCISSVSIQITCMYVLDYENAPSAKHVNIVNFSFFLKSTDYKACIIINILVLKHTNCQCYIKNKNCQCRASASNKVFANLANISQNTFIA